MAGFCYPRENGSVAPCASRQLGVDWSPSRSDCGHAVLSLSLAVSPSQFRLRSKAVDIRRLWARCLLSVVGGYNHSSGSGQRLLTSGDCWQAVLSLSLAVTVTV